MKLNDSGCISSVLPIVQEPYDRSRQRGKLRIGNDWSAITIIALSQSNPLKAIAELVENSTDGRSDFR